MTIPVRIHVPAEPRLVVRQGRLAFPAGVDTASLILANAGDAILTWSATPAVGWVVLTPSSGTLAPKDSVVARAAVSRSQIPTGSGDSFVLVTSNDRHGDITVTVAATNTSAWPNGLTFLDHRVVDAEYNRAVDVLVTVSADPSRLHVLDPLLGRIRSVDLSLPPTAVSISPRGDQAAVGHDGYVTLVNLAGPTITRVYPVTADALDVVLGGNGWTYVFPRRDQWESIRCIELSSGVESNSGWPSIYAGTVARLHPSGDYMYGANRGLSPSDFEKYDIRNGCATVMYDSPYHGDYSFAGDVWITDVGTRLFARSGNVFRSSSVRAEDMLYNGKLAGTSYLKWAEHSSTAGLVLVFDTPSFGGTPAKEIRVYEDEFLNLVSTRPLANFSGSWASHGKFIFVDSKGRFAYALVQADPAAGIAKDWGVITMDVSALR
ncbi:MAG TPA: hypothetical protein VLA36_02535 [Longimicrobiales bacterium]|nr:hypothetical protein [Longimicrobiales bacterium]